MAKRDRDTGIWKDPFYRGLPPLYKSFWDFLNDDCDNCGVWCVDWSWAKICIGKKVDPEKAINFFGDRIQVFDSGKKWHVKTFVSEKLGFTQLNPAHKFQKSIIDLLVKHKIDSSKGYPDTLQSVKDMGKDNDIGKDKGRDSAPVEKFEYTLSPNETLANFKDYEQWTKDVVEGNDQYFPVMLKNEGIKLNGELIPLAKSFLGLLAQYPKKAPPDQHRFRVALIGHISENTNKNYNGKRNTTKGSTGQNGPEPDKDYRANGGF